MGKPDTSLFDWSVYGALVRNARNRLGYKTAEAFSETIWFRTRVSVSSVSLYRIEQGRQVPDAMQFMGINMALFGAILPDALIDPCISRDWHEITSAFTSREDVTPSAPYIPEAWRRQNCEVAQNAETEGYLIEDKDTLFWEPIPPADPGALE